MKYIERKIKQLTGEGCDHVALVVKELGGDEDTRWWVALQGADGDTYFMSTSSRHLEACGKDAATALMHLDDLCAIDHESE